MSLLGSYSNVALGKTELYFLWIILTGLAADAYQNDKNKKKDNSARSTSAYNIKSYLNNEGKQPMAYQNVHKRIKRLAKLGLIEEERRGKRNAIMYKLTSHGLLQLILNYYSAPMQDVNLSYTADPLIQTIVYQFFEPETIRKFQGSHRSSILGSYVKKCCQTVLDQLQKPTTDEQIEKLIKNEAKEFIFQIVVDSNLKFSSLLPKIKRVNPGQMGIRVPSYKEPEDPDRAFLYPILTLMKDKLFRESLTEIKKEFDKGCRTFAIT